MLIGFIGAPCSGKTTTAAMAFADLKNMGFSVEFIPERARLYIAGKRSEHPGAVTLDDQDQVQIMKSQEHDELIITAGYDGVVITDSSVLNTLLYLSPEARDRPDIQEIISKSLTRYSLLFYSGPVKASNFADPNRIHGEIQSLSLDQSIPGLIEKYTPGLIPITLFGDSQQRHHEVVKTILERMIG